MLLRRKLADGLLFTSVSGYALDLMPLSSLRSVLAVIIIMLLVSMVLVFLKENKKTDGLNYPGVITVQGRSRIVIWERMTVL